MIVLDTPIFIQCHADLKYIINQIASDILYTDGDDVVLTRTNTTIATMVGVSSIVFHSYNVINEPDNEDQEEFDDNINEGEFITCLELMNTMLSTFEELQEEMLENGTINLGDDSEEDDEDDFDSLDNGEGDDHDTSH